MEGASTWHKTVSTPDLPHKLLMFQIKMLRDRIDDQRIVPTSDERAELLRRGKEINQDVADVMLVVRPQTYRRWLSPTPKTRSPKPVGCPGTAEDVVALILRMAIVNLSWGIFPLSFREFLDGKGIESDGTLSTKQRLTIQKAFEDYWQVGVFPA